MDIELPLVTLRVDFNSISEGLITASKRQASVLWYGLELGRLVRLEDAELNTCAGVVEVPGEVVVRVRPLWATWSAGPDVSLVYGFRAVEAPRVYELGSRLPHSDAGFMRIVA